MTTINTCKVVGTCGLGLVTGMLATFPLIVTPAILANETSNGASKAFASFTQRAQRLVTGIYTTSACAFAAAFLLSPRQARHPYLLYAMLGLPLGAGWGVLVMAPVTHDIVVSANGEQLGQRMEQWNRRHYGQTAIAACAFVLSVVGLHGDWVV